MLTLDQVVVKWLQIILAILGLVVLSMFSLQAYLRRTTRENRMGEKQIFAAAAAHET